MRTFENSPLRLGSGAVSHAFSGVAHMVVVKLAPLLQIIYLAGCGAIMVLAVQSFVGLDVIAWPLLPAGLIIVAVYLFNRHSDDIEDRINGRGGQDYFVRRPVLLYGALMLLAITYGLLWWAGELALHHLILLLVGASYSRRLLPWWRRGCGLTMVRIKDLPAFKNLTVALLWGTSPFVLGLAPHRYDLWADSLLVIVMGAFTLASWSNTFFNDILDRRGDAMVGNRTLAVRLGVEGSLRMLGLVNVLWAAVTLALFGLGVIDKSVLLFLALLITVPLLAIIALRSGRLVESTLKYLSEVDLLIMVLGLLFLQ